MNFSAAQRFRVSNHAAVVGTARLVGTKGLGWFAFRINYIADCPN